MRVRMRARARDEEDYRCYQHNEGHDECTQKTDRICRHHKQEIISSGLAVPRKSNQKSAPGILKEGAAPPELKQLTPTEPKELEDKASRILKATNLAMVLASLSN